MQRARDGCSPRREWQSCVGSKVRDPMTQGQERHGVRDKSQVEVAPRMSMTDRPPLCPLSMVKDTTPDHYPIHLPIHGKCSQAVCKRQIGDIPAEICRGDDARPTPRPLPSGQEGLQPQQSGKIRADKSPTSLPEKRHIFGHRRCGHPIGRSGLDHIGFLTILTSSRR